MVGVRRNIYIKSKDIVEEIEIEAKKRDRSFGNYLIECHRIVMGGGIPEVIIQVAEKPVVAPRENPKPVIQKKAAKPPEAPEPIMGYSEPDRSWDALRKPMPKGGK